MYDSTIYPNNVPIRLEAHSQAPSERSSAASLPPVRAMSVTSSAFRRKDMLLERQHELQAQLM